MPQDIAEYYSAKLAYWTISVLFCMFDEGILHNNALWWRKVPEYLEDKKPLGKLWF